MDVHEYLPFNKGLKILAFLELTGAMKVFVKINAENIGFGENHLRVGIRMDIVFNNSF